MSIPMININELHKEREGRINRKKEIYDTILLKCHQRIINASKADNSCFCFYTIPLYIYGVPLYNMKTCILYIIDCLSKNGFDIKYTHPNLIYISWLNKKNPKTIEYKANNNQTKNKYKTISEYKPSGNFIYDEESVNLLSNKTFNLLDI